MLWRVPVFVGQLDWNAQLLIEAKDGTSRDDVRGLAYDKTDWLRCFAQDNAEEFSYWPVQVGEPEPVMEI